MDDEKHPQSIDSKDFEVVKAEYIHNWIVVLIIRIFNELIPLIISILIAFIVALISSNFDHLMKILLETFEKLGAFRYLISLVFMAASTLVVHILHPTVRGSGIPEMKLFLENWESPRMKDYLTCKAMITKIIGLGLAILSGFPVGKEGPFVHISCAISYFIKFRVVPIFSGFLTTIYRRTLLLSTVGFTKAIRNHYMCWKLNYLRDVDVYRFLCTGCALGVACTFGAPIGGVMFSIEVTSQMFDISNYWQCFFTGMVGALFFRFFIGGVFHENWYFKPFLQSNIQGEEYELHHFLVYLGIGVACGILGSIFILIYFVFFKAGQIYYRILNFFFRKFPTKNTFKWSIFHPRTSPRRIIVTLIFTLSLTVVLCIGEFIQNQNFDNMPLSQHSQLTLFFDDDKRLLEKFQIKTNGNISHNNAEIDIQLNLNNYFKPLSLFLIMKILFFCPIVTCLPVPTGIFFPLTVTGACLGRLLGDLTKISSAGCAIVGAAGLSGAVTHSVSTAVIITEMTEEIRYLLPCAIAAFIGKLIVKIFAKYSIYNMIMRNRRMPYMPDEDEEIYSFFKKTDAANFFTSGNYISLGDKFDGKRQSLVLYYEFRDEMNNHNTDLVYTPNNSSTNGNLRSILSIIQSRSGEMQWKLIPVMRLKKDIETLIGFVRYEAAVRYLQKYFSLIIGTISTKELWLRDPTELSKIMGKRHDSRKFFTFCKQSVEYHLHDWESFLTEEINWEELLEEKPCAVTETTRLPDIQTFVQKNFLPQVFVLNETELCGLITRENIIEQIKLLHRQSGTLAVSYRGDLQSLPMKVIHPDQIKMKFLPDFFGDKNYKIDSNCGYMKLRTHSE